MLHVEALASGTFDSNDQVVAAVEVQAAAVALIALDAPEDVHRNSHGSLLFLVGSRPSTTLSPHLVSQGHLVYDVSRRCPRSP